MRWWIYQKERFPIAQHGPLVAAFSSSAVLYSALLTGGEVSWVSLLVAFIVTFLFFLQLRIADEFKDAEEDARYRPYRAVPRGLVSLRELGWVFVAAACVQLYCSMMLAPSLIFLLLLGWCYLALMSVEFFAADWLKARPVTYLWTHMLIMPLVDLFATACHWMPENREPQLGLAFFLGASFCNGIVIEVGRKIRQPSEEEEGVPTYSKLWGLSRVGYVWLGAIIATAILACAAAYAIRFHWVVLLMLSPVFVVAVWRVRNISSASSKHFELLSGSWTLVLYLSLGLIPFLL